MINKNLKSDYFDLSFAGDLFVLKTKYVFPINSLEIDKYLKQVNDERKVGNLIISRKDFVFVEKYSLNTFFLAEFEKKWNKITDHLNSYLNNNNLNFDSRVDIYQGIIDTDGNLKHLKLIYGSEDRFSVFTSELFSNLDSAWVPFTKDMRNFRSLVDIFIRVENGRIVECDYSTKLRQLKIEDPEPNKFLFYTK